MHRASIKAAAPAMITPLCVLAALALGLGPIVARAQEAIPTASGAPTARSPRPTR